jgi:hypothetical protein
MNSQNDRQFNRPVFFPGGVADPSGKTGYVSLLSSGIEAIELTAGRSLWHSDAARRALMVLGQRLAAAGGSRERPNILHVVVLDRAHQGRVLRVSDPVVFPDWVDTTATSEERFAYEVRGKEGVLWIDWEAHARYEGGAPPPSRVIREARKDAMGTVQVNLRTGHVVMIPRTAPPVPALPPALRQASLVPCKQGPSWHSEPWMTDNLLAALAVDEHSGQRTLVLQRWDAATQAMRPPLPLGSAIGKTAYVTPNGSYLLLHDLSAGGSAGDLSIFRVETGAFMARWPHESGLQALSILNTHIYSLVEEPVSTSGGSPRLRWMLKARVLLSGQLLWERLLLERQLSRPPPPRP